MPRIARHGLTLVCSCISALALASCGEGTSDAKCGEGTVLLGGMCVARMPGPGPATVDAGRSGSPSSTDAGFSAVPPSDGGAVSTAGGCDAATCEAWAHELLELVRTRCGAGVPADDVRIIRVATRHAAYQATVDRIDPSSPEGDLFDQVVREGLSYSDAAALFASTRAGPSDVLERWASRSDTASTLGRCLALGGGGFASSATGTAYVTLLFVQP